MFPLINLIILVKSLYWMLFYSPFSSDFITRLYKYYTVSHRMILSNTFPFKFSERYYGNQKCHINVTLRTERKSKYTERERDLENIFVC